MDRAILYDEQGNPVSLNASAGVKLVIQPTLADIAAYATGHVLFDFMAVPSVLTGAGRISMLQDMLIADKGDTGATLTFLWANASAVLGTPHNAPSISDADSFKITGIVNVAATDWVDLGGNRVACLRNLGIVLRPASGTSSYFAGMITPGGTGGTFASTTDLQILAGILQG